MFGEIQKRAIREAVENERLAFQMAALSGSNFKDCLKVLRNTPPTMRDLLIGGLNEGMTIDQMNEIIGDTFLSDAWRIVGAGHDIARVMVGAIPVQQVTPDELASALNAQIKRKA